MPTSGKKKPLEKEVSAQIRRTLDLMERIGEIVWYERLNSGKIEFRGAWIQLCRPGTPDYICILYIGDELYTLFIEVKRPGGRMTEVQLDFMQDYCDKRKVHHLLCTNHVQIRDKIKCITQKKS